jgi:IclR family acetate operon transcriptional repressor
MPKQTPKTLTSIKAFLAELDRVRAQGYAIDDEENQPGGVCVAVPVPRQPGYALSLSAPASRLTADQARVVSGRLAEVAEALAPEAPHYRS